MRLHYPVAEIGIIGTHKSLTYAFSSKFSNSIKRNLALRNPEKHFPEKKGLI